MPRRTLETGPVVAVVGAVLLMVALFLDWFRAGGEAGGLSGWTSFEVLDLVLAALALAAGAIAIERMGYGAPRVPGSLSLVGAVALVVVASQLVNHPPAGIDRSPELGAWLALGGAVLIVAGGLIGRARISFELVRDAPGSVAPEAGRPPSGPATPGTQPDEDETRRIP